MENGHNWEKAKTIPLNNYVVATATTTEQTIVIPRNHNSLLLHIHLVAIQNLDSTIDLFCQIGYKRNGVFFPLANVTQVGAGNISYSTNEIYLQEHDEIYALIQSASSTVSVMLYVNGEENMRGE